jgi:hypothetical protein
MSPMNAVFRPTFGRVLTAVIGAICVVAAVITLAEGGPSDLGRVAPWLALFAGGCWAAFWRPRVEVSDGGVRIVNVTRTIDVPWPAIKDIETKWALKVVTAYGEFSAWAAPAGGRGPARRASRIENNLLSRARVTEHLAPPTSLDGAAGDAAEIVRGHWAALRAAGHLDNPVLEHEKAPVRWHVETLAIGAALIVLGVIAANV